MKTIRTIAVIWMLLWFCRSSSMCQSLEAPSLKGIPSVYIIVGDVDDHNPCGITKADVLTSVKFIIGQSSLRIDESSSVAVAVSVLSLEGCSATRIDVEVLAPATILASNQVDYAARIWSQGGVMTGPNQQTRSLQQIEALCKKLVVDWNTANPKRTP